MREEYLTTDVVNVSALIDCDVECFEFLHQLSVLLHQLHDGLLHLLQRTLLLTHLLVVLLHTHHTVTSHASDDRSVHAS